MFFVKYESLDWHNERWAEYESPKYKTLERAYNMIDKMKKDDEKYKNPYPAKNFRIYEIKRVK